MHPRSRPQVRPGLPSSTDNDIDQQALGMSYLYNYAPAAGSHCFSSTAWGSFLQHHASD